MAKIYTKTGDLGMTGLFAGPRVSKSNIRIEAYGAVDELNAVLGCVAAEVDSNAPLLALLNDIQSDLFSIGAELATPNPKEHGTAWSGDDRIECLEKEIDVRDSQLPPLTEFILPGGTKAAGFLHWARTVCRRAERRVVFFQESEEPVPTSAIKYLNRLSDLLFVLARESNDQAGRAETTWKST